MQLHTLLPFALMLFYIAHYCVNSKNTFYFGLFLAHMVNSEAHMMMMGMRLV